jgi:type IV pilus biogenesis protein PilP
MKTRKSLQALLCCMALGSGVAQADTAPVPASDAQAHKSQFDALDSINSDNALLAAQIKNAQLRKQLADAQAGRDPSNPQGAAQPGVSGGPSNILPGGTSVPTQAFASASPRGAVVLLVTTSPQVNKGAPTALIQLPSGGRVSATVGTKVPGVGTFKEVSTHSVLVEDGKRVVALPFDGDDQAASVGSR